MKQDKASKKPHTIHPAYSLIQRLRRATPADITPELLHETCSAISHLLGKNEKLQRKLARLSEAGSANEATQ